MSRYLVIRADANARMGTGHLMRCLALAQGWKARGGQTTFITVCESDGLRHRLSDEGFQVITLERSYPDPADWEITSQVLAEYRGAWLVLDGYHFDPAYQRQVKEAGHRLLVIDDTAHLSHYYADVLLNQNINAEWLYYSREPYTRLLLGTRYVLLRSEFLAWRGWHREIPQVARKVLVTMGGGDPDNVTLKVIHALQKVEVDELEAVVVVGGSNPHVEVLQSEAQGSRFKIRLERDVLDMPALMAWADLAVSAGGSTCWEIAFMGLPVLVLVWAANQRDVAEGLGEIGAALNLGWHEQATPTHIAQAITRLLLSPQVRAEMSCKAQGMVDGVGAGRAMMAMSAQSLVLRRVTESDCEMLWEWINDPDVRASAFRSEHIPIEEHRQWFYGKLKDPQCFLFIGLDGSSTPIGQVRFDVRDDEAEVDVSVARNQRGKGYGSYLIRKAVQELQRIMAIRTVHAFVRPENQASLRAFQKAGFIYRGLEMVKGHNATRLTWRENG